MSKTIIAQPNQTMPDVVICGCGSLEAAMQFCEDNGVSLSDIPDVGKSYVVSDEALALADSGVLDYYTKYSIQPGNLNLPGPALPLGLVVLMYPYMGANMDAAVTAHPDTIGYWEFDMTFGSLSVFVNDLLAAPYLSAPNPMAYASEGVIEAGTPMSLVNAFSSTLMDVWSLGTVMVIRIPYDGVSSGSGFVYVQSGYFIDGVHHTMQMEDVEGNRAVVSPFIVLKHDAPIMVDCLFPRINVEVVGSGPGSLTLRVIRSHPAIVTPDYANKTMTWIDECVGGTPDPADPGNPDKTILTFMGAGVHTLGVMTQYQDGTLTHVLGYSMIEMVVAIS